MRPYTLSRHYVEQVLEDFTAYDSNNQDDYNHYDDRLFLERRRRRRSVCFCWWPWFTGGRSTSEVLDNAGVNVFSDAYIHEIDGEYAVVCITRAAHRSRDDVTTVTARNTITWDFGSSRCAVRNVINLDALLFSILLQNNRLYFRTSKLIPT